jgi:hypothetical protein
MEISVVVTTRNDDHGGQQIPRVNMFMRSLRESARLGGAEVELVIVEWNPPPDRPLLSEEEALEWTVPTRIITVPPEIHNALPNNNVGPLYQMIAKNVGVRRATHEWIACSNPDLFYGPTVFSGLEPVLGKGKLFRIPRVDIKSTVVPSQSNYAQELDELKDHKIERHNRPWVCGQPLLTDACGDWQLLHRTDWEKAGGYWEHPVWSIHMDSLFSVTAMHAGMQEIVVNSALYHLDHDRSWVKNPEEIQQRPHIELQDVVGLHNIMRASGRHIRFNQPDWGYNDVDFDTWTAP